MPIKLIFKIIAILFIPVAIYLYWQSNMDGVFIAAVLGSVCFFLSIRFDLREKVKASEPAPQTSEDE
jgi:hypothetical protein